jgi:hippurate hydrolase
MTADLMDVMTPFRRSLHSEPEVGLDLPRTQEKVLEALSSLPYETSTGAGCTSVTAVLRSGNPGPTVLLRGDMDALPVAEKTGQPFAATNGNMHACGHDLHTAMLVGAAHLLADRREQLAGDVVLMFQPGEEGYDGAGVMLAEGVLDASGSTPIAAYALHVTASAIPQGVFAGRRGATMSAADKLLVTVRGQGGHGSTPHRAQDSLLAASAIVTALELAVTREFDVFDPVVVTTGMIHGGTAHNVISEEVSFESTVRSFSAEAKARLEVVLPRVVKGIAMAHGVEVDVEYVTLFPPTISDVDEAAWALDLGRESLGEDRVLEFPNPLAGSEDFSRVLERVPGAMLFLGATPTGLDPVTAPYNHAPEADFDETVMATGAQLYATLAEQRLKKS